MSREQGRKDSETIANCILMMEENTEIYCKPRHGTLQKLITSGNGLLFKTRIFNPADIEGGEDISVKHFPREEGVPSLYQQCMDLLSHYTHLFESLVDFPLDFGKEIFDKSIKHLLSDNENSKRSLEIFSEAYPSEFLPTCKLARCLPLLNNYELCLPALLSQVVKLEIIDSNIDDDHDILEAVVNLHNLQELSLSSNDLTDAGLKRLVLPSLGRKKLSRLSHLDISFNKLNEKAVRRLKVMPCLDTIVLGECDLSNLVQILQPTYLKRPCPRLSKVETAGFGAALLEQWSIEVGKQSKGKKMSGQTAAFYSKDKKKEQTNITDSAIHHVEVRKNKLMFSKQKSLTENQQGIQISHGFKRKSGGCTSDNTFKRPKIVQPLANNLYEEDLLNIYKC